ncbi:MAG: MFS transporter [Bacteroidetes bacterium]|nr:MFS transporter [Bacteroidota bacterium]MBS1758001.1 MFS transporter [Bacteroidota bacterium]
MQAAIGKYRWTICSLLFLATTINYLDRAVISLLKPFIAEAFHWDAVAEIKNYADIEIVFKIAYTIGMLGAGRLIDRLGTKIGYALSTLMWSISAVAHAIATGTIGFGVARGFLGIFEAGNFPAAIKATAEWFPKKERAYATGVFNSGSSIGAIVAPVSVPWIAIHLGWQWAFIITGSIGFIWLILWFIYYEIPAKQARLSKAEFDYIHSDKEEESQQNNKSVEKISWAKLLSYKQTWAFAIGKFITDPIWWFYLFWLPDFLNKQYGLVGTQVSIPVAVVYIMAMFGSIYGGFLPMYLINKGWPVFKARKTSMLIYAFCVFPIVFAQLAGSVNMWGAVILIGLAASAHQAWSANIFTTVSDMFPKKTVGVVTGIGGMAGGLGGIVLSWAVQKNMFVYFEKLGKIDTGYYIMFFICGLSYLIAWIIMHFMVPTLKRIDL